MEFAYLPDSAMFVGGRLHSSNDLWSNVNSCNTKKTYTTTCIEKVDERNCYICKDKRRKSLSNYIKNKSRRDSEPDTHIREEEAEDECTLSRNKDKNKR